MRRPHKRKKAHPGKPEAPRVEIIRSKRRRPQREAEDRSGGSERNLSALSPRRQPPAITEEGISP